MNVNTNMVHLYFVIIMEFSKLSIIYSLDCVYKSKLIRQIKYRTKTKIQDVLMLRQILNI